MKKYTFLTHVLNRPGVLNKVTMMVRRKMYNIDSLTVSPTRNPDISSMTMVFVADDAAAADKVRAQLARIVELKSIEQLSEKDSVQEELMLLKVTPKSQKSLEKLLGGMFSRVVFKSNAHVIIEAVGSKKELNALLKKVPAGEILEIACTGVTSMKFN